MNNPFAQGSGLASAYRVFQEHDLPMPPIPSAFLYALTQRNPVFFSSHTGVDTLDEVDRLAEEAASDDAVPYIAFGLVGYGLNNIQLRYAVVTETISAFVSLPIGGIYDDPVLARNVIHIAFRDLSAVLAQDNSTRRVVVQQSNNGRWCNVGGDWKEDPRALSTLVTQQG